MINISLTLTLIHRGYGLCLELSKNLFCFALYTYHLNSQFPGEPGLACAFLIFIPRVCYETMQTLMTSQNLTPSMTSSTKSYLEIQFNLHIVCVTQLVSTYGNTTHYTYKQQFSRSQSTTQHYHGCLQAWARGGTCRSGNVVFCELVVTCSKTLNRQIIYALFSQPVVGFWGLHPRPPSPRGGSIPGHRCRATLVSSLNPNLCTPGKKFAGDHDYVVLSLARNDVVVTVILIY